MTPPILRGKMGKFYKLAFELRYQYGYTYLDRCGRTINAIQREAPEWLTTEPGPQGAALLSIRNECIFNFSSSKLDLVVEQSIDDQLPDESIEVFAGQVELLSAIVIDQLGLEEFSRIGLRGFFAYPATDREDIENWMLSLGWFSLSDSLRAAFGPAVESTSFVAVMQAGDLHYRLAAAGVEKPAQVNRAGTSIDVRPSTLSKGQDKAYKAQLLRRRKNLASASYAVSIDVDAYQESPISPDVGDFVKTSLDQMGTRLRRLAAP